MAAVIAKENATKKDGKDKKNSVDSMTINFIPETQRYSKPTNMEEFIWTYFEGINGINRRIIAEERKVVAQNRNTWSSLPVEDRDKLLNDRFISNDTRKKYNTSEDYWKEKTPWQIDDSSQHKEQFEAMSINDSFSRPFQWATKSQRNLKFPAVRHNVASQISKVPPSTEGKEIAMDDVTLKKMNNVEASLKEKQMKTANENIVPPNSDDLNSIELKTKGKSSPIKKNENIVVEVDKEEFSSSQPNDEGAELKEGSNLFEFLQSWNP